jgi:hypothetical protein
MFCPCDLTNDETRAKPVKLRIQRIVSHIPTVHSEGMGLKAIVIFKKQSSFEERVCCLTEVVGQTYAYGLSYYKRGHLGRAGSFCFSFD